MRSGWAVARTVQHKPARDDRRGRETQDLKKQVRILRREVARVSKENAHLRSILDTHGLPDMKGLDAQISEEPVERVATNIEDDLLGPRCTRCQSGDVKDLKLPFGSLRCCVSCNHREKI